MALPASDLFTGTGNLLTGWDDTAGASFVRSSDNAIPANYSNDFVAYWSGDAFANDQYSEIIVGDPLGGGAGTNGAGIGVGVRINSAKTTLYRYICSATGPELAKIVASAFTTIAITSTTWATGDVCRLSISGSTITLYKNAGVVGTATDSAIASGSAGITYSSSANATSIASWTGGNVGAASNKAMVTNPRFPWVMLNF